MCRKILLLPKFENTLCYSSWQNRTTLFRSCNGHVFLYVQSYARSVVVLCADFSLPHFHPWIAWGGAIISVCPYPWQSIQSIRRYMFYIASNIVWNIFIAFIDLLRISCPRRWFRIAFRSAKSFPFWAHIFFYTGLTKFYPFPIVFSTSMQCFRWKF